MKLLWKHGLRALILAAVLSQANAIVPEQCPTDFDLKNTGLGRRICQSNKAGVISNTDICFRCPLSTDQYGLDKLCENTYPEQCKNSRCASNFIDSCKRSCEGATGQKYCETMCEDEYKNKCTPGCSAIMPTWNGDC